MTAGALPTFAQRFWRLVRRCADRFDRIDGFVFTEGNIDTQTEALERRLHRHGIALAVYSPWRSHIATGPRSIADECEAMRLEQALDVRPPLASVLAMPKRKRQDASRPHEFVGNEKTPTRCKLCAKPRSNFIHGNNTPKRA